MSAVGAHLGRAFCLGPDLGPGARLIASEFGLRLCPKALAFEESVGAGEDLSRQTALGPYPAPALACRSLGGRAEHRLGDPVADIRVRTCPRRIGGLGLGRVQGSEAPRGFPQPLQRVGESGPGENPVGRRAGLVADGGRHVCQGEAAVVGQLCAECHEAVAKFGQVGAGKGGREGSAGRGFGLSFQVDAAEEGEVVPAGGHQEVSLGGTFCGELCPHGTVQFAGDHPANVLELRSLQARLTGRRPVSEPGQQVDVGLAGLAVHGADPAEISFRHADMKRELRHDAPGDVSPVGRRTEPKGCGVLLPQGDDRLPVPRPGGDFGLHGIEGRCAGGVRAEEAGGTGALVEVPRVNGRVWVVLLGACHALARSDVSGVHGGALAGPRAGDPPELEDEGGSQHWHHLPLRGVYVAVQADLRAPPS